MDMNDVFAVINTEKAAALCLSKGGWEGWLQCELWSHLSLEKGETVEREVAYPESRERCDLVIGSNSQLWVELKAYAIFREGDANRFLDAVAYDIDKLSALPEETEKLVLVVVPQAIAESFSDAISQRGWNGFEVVELTYAFVFYMNVYTPRSL